MIQKICVVRAFENIFAKNIFRMGLIFKTKKSHFISFCFQKLNMRRVKYGAIPVNITAFILFYFFACFLLVSVSSLIAFMP